MRPNDKLHQRGAKRSALWNRGERRARIRAVAEDELAGGFVDAFVERGAVVRELPLCPAEALKRVRDLFRVVRVDFGGPHLRQLREVGQRVGSFDPNQSATRVASPRVTEYTNQIVKTELARRACPGLEEVDPRLDYPTPVGDLVLLGAEPSAVVAELVEVQSCQILRRDGGRDGVTARRRS